MYQPGLGWLGVHPMLLWCTCCPVKLCCRSTVRCTATTKERNMQQHIGASGSMDSCNSGRRIRRSLLLLVPVLSWSAAVQSSASCGRRQPLALHGGCAHYRTDGVTAHMRCSLTIPVVQHPAVHHTGCCTAPSCHTAHLWPPDSHRICSIQLIHLTPCRLHLKMHRKIL
jgi:hypothetical protein